MENEDYSLLPSYYHSSPLLLTKIKLTEEGRSEGKKNFRLRRRKGVNLNTAVFTTLTKY